MGEGPRAFESAEAKVRRADQQIQALRQSFELFRDLHPYSVGLDEPDMQIATEPAILRATLLPTGELLRLSMLAWTCVASICLTPVVEPPILEWGVMVGEIAHNLASALDNLVWALGQPLADPPAPMARGRLERGIAFPYCRAADEWETASRRRLFRVPAAAQAVLEGAQPFHAREHGWESPEDHPLWVLHELWNRDKHRAVSLVTVSGQCTGIRIRLPGLPADAPDLVTEMLQTWPSRPLQGKTEVAKVRIHLPGLVPVPSEMNVQVYGQFALQVRFDEVGSRQDLDALLVLMQAHDIVANIIDELREL